MRYFAPTISIALASCMFMPGMGSKGQPAAKTNPSASDQGGGPKQAAPKPERKEWKPGMPFAVTIENKSKHPLCRVAAFPGTGTESAPYTDANAVFPLDAKTPEECIQPGGSKKVEIPLWSVSGSYGTYRQRLFETIGASGTVTKFDASQPPGYEMNVCVTCSSEEKLVIKEPGEIDPSYSGDNGQRTTIEGLQRQNKANEATKKVTEADAKKCIASMPKPTGAADPRTKFSGKWSCIITGQTDAQDAHSFITFIPGGAGGKVDANVLFSPSQQTFNWSLELHGKKALTEVDHGIVVFDHSDASTVRVDQVIYWGDVGCQHEIWACSRSR